MKPKLDAVTENVVKSLSGEARGFYDREFNFFNEVTSISGKLKPYIKRTKPEKKVAVFCNKTLAITEPVFRRRLMRRWLRLQWMLVYIFLATLMASW
jgi:hypothetical protein